MNAVFSPNVNTETPQGSTFSPVLFLILTFSNDIASVGLITEYETRYCGWNGLITLLVGVSPVWATEKKRSWNLVKTKKNNCVLDPTAICH